MHSVCPACNHENRPEAFFCSQCGTKLHFPTTVEGHLLRMNGSPQERRIAIPSPVCVLGRDPSSSIRLEEESVSKEHARLQHADGRFEIEDLASSNGTFVNGRRVHGRAPVKSGDLIRLGAVILKLEV